MDFRNTSPTLSDFENCAWEEAVETAEIRECSAYWESSGAKAKEAQEAGNEQAQKVFTLLNAATSLCLKEPNNATSPFCPKFTSPKGRTADVGDFMDEHLAVFSQLIPTIEDPELRARIADIVWVRKRGHQVAAQGCERVLGICMSLGRYADTMATVHRQNKACRCRRSASRKKLADV